MANKNPFDLLTEASLDEAPKPKTVAPRRQVKPNPASSAPAPRPSTFSTPEIRKETAKREPRDRRGGPPKPGRPGKPAEHEGFDRRSGTGRGREVKRGGRGERNWGAPGEEANWEDKVVPEPEPAESPAPVPAPEGEKPAENATQEAQPAEPAGPTELTLAEYEALKASKLGNRELPQPRQSESSLDEENLIPHEEEVFFEGSARVKPRKERKQKQKETISVHEFMKGTQFADRMERQLARQRREQRLREPRPDQAPTTGAPATSTSTSTTTTTTTAQAPAEGQRGPRRDNFRGPRGPRRDREPRPEPRPTSFAVGKDEFEKAFPALKGQAAPQPETQQAPAEPQSAVAQ